MYGDLLNPAGPAMGAPPQPPAGPPPPLGIPPGAALGVGQGAPPAMPGLPPPPTGKGAMPTGDPSTNKKEAADNAILSLRELKGHYPSLGQTLDQAIDQIKSAAKSAAPAKAALGTPTTPGQPPADDTSTMQSGGPGGF